MAKPETIERLLKAYPDSTAQSIERLADTCDRIGERVEGWQAEEREKTAALAWCRANGNPHRQQ